MTTRPSHSAALSGATAAFASANALAKDPAAVDNLILRIKSQDDNIRAAAWQEAGSFGAPAIKPLATVLANGELEISRSAKRALWKIVHQAGRPGAESEAKAVTSELVSLLNGSPVMVCREILWMISEIAGADTVKPIAALLSNRDLREDARAALERIPGTESLEALKQGLETVAEEFKSAMAHSLRVRGVAVPGYPSQKLVPTRPGPAGSPSNL